MTTIAFIDLANNFYDRHAVYSLTAVLTKAGHKVYYVGTMKFKEIMARLEAIKPELLLYSTFTQDIQRYARLDALIKKRMKVTSLIGGHGPTYDPERIVNTGIDAMCIGEGERALTEYVDSGFKGNRNILCSDEFSNVKGAKSGWFAFAALDDLPMPDRSLVYAEDAVLREQPSKQFMAGRGCPYKCTYCHNHAFNEKFKESGPIIRFKSVDYLIAEINEVKRRWPLKTVVFQDDVFILKREWLMEFCERFPREVGLPFTCNIKAEIAVREEIVQALKAGGCIHAAWSIESGNDHLRNDVLKRNMSREQILGAAKNLNKYKIPHRIGNVLGIPGETFANIRETLELNIASRPNLAIGSVFVPYPGLELTEYALKNSYLDADKVGQLPATLYERSVLNFTPEENLRIQKVAYLFPLLVQFPALYRNNRLFEKGLLKLPRRFLRLVYDVFFAVKMAGFFKMSLSTRMRLEIFKRYLAQSTALALEKDNP